VNRHRPNFYRRVRLFCELSLGDESLATGISATRLSAIEIGRTQPNGTEIRLIESFLRAKFQTVLETEGPAPDWLHRDGIPAKRLTA
jgi:hypothetical protein